MLSSFFNDIVIVCTVAIVIGQHIRTEIVERISNKKTEVVDEFNKLNHSGFSADSQIAKQLDDIKAYQCADLSVFNVLFLLIILVALLVNIIRCSLEALDSAAWLITTANFVKIAIEGGTFILLIIYADRLRRIKNGFTTFNASFTSFMTGLDFVIRMNKQNPPNNSSSANTPSAGATPDASTQRW